MSASAGQNSERKPISITVDQADVVAMIRALTRAARDTDPEAGFVLAEIAERLASAAGPTLLRDR